MINKTRGRLILAIISTAIEEAALAVIVLVGLPRVGVNIPVAVLVAVMLGWLVIAVGVYRAGSRALQRKAVSGFGAMTGSRGKVVKALQPVGLVKVGGELWRAEATGKALAVGEEVIVVGQQGGKPLVKAEDEEG